MPAISAQVGKALVDFSSKNEFPDSDDVSAAPVEGTVITTVYRALSDAKIGLETEIRSLSRDSAPDVETWIATAKALQKDIKDLRALANNIVKQVEEDSYGNKSELQELHVEFLEKEISFNSQLGDALLAIKEVEDCLRKADRLATDKKIIESLQLLADSQVALGKISIPDNTRVYYLLRSRFLARKDAIHEEFLSSWKKLVLVDPAGRFTINKSIDREALKLQDAVTVLVSYNELDQTAVRLWEDLDEAIVKPRTEITIAALRAFEIHDNGISLAEGSPEDTIEMLLKDVEGLTTVLTTNLPEDFVSPLAKAMMPPLTSRIREMWLDKVIPHSLEDMEQYRASLAQVHSFADKINALHWPGTETLYDWGRNAPRLWLNKRKETELDNTRNQLAHGVGQLHSAEHIETHEVSQEVSADIVSAGSKAVVSDEWDAAWDSDEKSADPLNDTPPAPLGGTQDAPITIEDDPADDDAWGWGDETTEVPEDTPPEEAEPLAESKSKAKKPNRNHAVTLKETYQTSSMPGPVYESIVNIYEDGVKLSKTDDSPIALATAGLFGLPTQILALYRAVSKQYYATHPSGNMLLYNDCTWLCDKLTGYLTEWKATDDLSPRIKNLVKLDPEITKLQGFGKRAYKEELISQRTTVADLLGGTQNFLQTNRQEDLEQGIDSVLAHIRALSTEWTSILPYSVLASVLGSLVNKIASKLIADVLELPSLNADAAESTALLISRVETLDSLFHNDETPKFADQWMKMKFLSEVLQSNLKDIRFLWFESHLGLYFTKEEVLDLISLSFEENVNSKALKKEIRDSRLQ
ncbi:centromere/kinetochore protein-like protein zw10 [Calycina marina]|uniref:Centromere/kinetochore protein-like protein zw10 n=1 Tax=Calycina marina TaxID=1763456 RepID=A0A9P8CGZ5_9HELO|nr:centromere/kinetochore protein-like protein zw10 [Calycina marina]